MHEYSDQFYCVCCNQLLGRKEADILFRTGYFRVIYPLGCCVACERRERHTAELPDHPRLVTGAQVFRIEPLTDKGSGGIGVHRIASGSHIPLYWNDELDRKTMNVYP